jgi:hypothetical protein
MPRLLFKVGEVTEKRREKERESGNCGYADRPVIQIIDHFKKTNRVSQYKMKPTIAAYTCYLTPDGVKSGRLLFINRR